jgi:hypothetical protein
MISVKSKIKETMAIKKPIEETEAIKKPIEETEAIKKLLNFIAGMMEMIPGYKDKGIFLEKMIDEEKKPECTHKAFQTKYKSVHITQEQIEMDKIKETNKLINDIIDNLGNSEKVRKIAWSNPKEACKNVLKLQKEKYSNVKKHSEKTKKLSEFALKVYNNNETFTEFNLKKGKSITRLFHKNRIKLGELILLWNFDGNEKEMEDTYKDNKEKWRQDLLILSDILKESESAARQIKEDLLDLKENLPDCSILPESKELPDDEVRKFISNFIGGILVIQQVTVCFGIHTMIFKTVLSLGIKRLVKIVASLFGLIFTGILAFTVSIAQVGYYLYRGKKTDENSDFEQKYKYYGRAAGALFNMILTIIGLL